MRRPKNQTAGHRNAVAGREIEQARNGASADDDCVGLI